MGADGIMMGTAFMTTKECPGSIDSAWTVKEFIDNIIQEAEKLLDS